MALTKTDYGLIYNDDGSLCVTVRDDDTPFQGVKSFAVEESTENLFEFFSNNGTSLEILDDYKYKITNITNTNSFSNVQTNTLSVADGESITFSFFYTKKDNPQNTLSIVIEVFVNNSYLRMYTRSQQDYVHSFIYKNTTGTTVNVMFRIGLFNSNGFEVNDYIIIKKPQLEKKPFATSFVDGSRQGGRLSFPDNTDNNNFVISLWYKTSEFDTDHYVCQLYKDNDNRINLKAYISGKTVFEVVYPKETSGYYVSSAASTTHLNLNEWTHYVWIKDNNNVKVYLNGNKIIDSELTINNLEKLKNIRFFAETNSKISNLFIGKYKDDNGNVIWTEQFIKEQYQMKKPYHVPPKLPIV